MKQAIFNRMKAHTVLDSKRGLTLIELLVAFAILMLVFTIVFQFFNFSGNMFRKTDDLAVQQDQARLIIFGLRKDLGAALDISSMTYHADTEPSSIPTGYEAIYVDSDGRLTKKYDNSKENIYSSSPVKDLQMQFTSDASDKYVLHVVILVNFEEIASTDIYIRNLAEQSSAWDTIPEKKSDPIPNTITYKPAPSDAP